MIITTTELEAEAQAKQIKGFNEGATNGMVFITTKMILISKLII